MKELDRRQQITKRRSKSGADAATRAPRPESRSLAKGLQILETLRESSSPLPLRELSGAIGLGKASTLRLVRTLLASGYIARDTNENYGLAHEWPAADNRVRARRIQQIASPFLARLAAQFGETASLACLFGDMVRVVDVVESTHHIRMSNYRGRVLQPYASSLGKAIAAFQPPEKIQALLDTYGIYSLTPATLTDVRAIQQDLARVRERGVAFDSEETVPGGQCVGAPIRDDSGAVVAAISVSMPKLRYSKEVGQVLPDVLKKTADEISAALGAKQ